MTLSNKLYRLRTEHSMSQEQLADRLEVSRQSVSKWETGTSVPDLDKLIKICDIFSVSLDEITGRNENTDIAQSIPESNIANISLPSYSNAPPYFDDAESTRRKRRAFGILFLAVSLLIIAAAVGVSIFIGYDRFGILVFLPAIPALTGAVVCLTVKRNTAAVCIASVIISVIIAGILFFSLLLYGLFGMNTASEDAHIDIRAETYSFESAEPSE